jgi:polyhydroxyalkanoate synthesis regulator phasin
MAKRKKTYKTRRAHVRALQTRVEVLQREVAFLRAHSYAYQSAKDALDPIPGETVSEKIEALRAATAFTLRRLRVFVATKARPADVPENHVPAVIMTDVLDHIDREGSRVLSSEMWSKFVYARATLTSMLERITKAREMGEGKQESKCEMLSEHEVKALRDLVGVTEPVAD